MMEERPTMSTTLNGSGSSATSTDPIRFTAIDPGKFIGWARFENGTPITVGVLEFGPVFFEWLQEELPDLFVVEDYIIRPGTVQRGFQHQWNKGEALQVKGIIRYHGATRMIPVEFQQPSIQPMSAQRTGMPYKKGRSNDINSAVLHGAHWWFKNYGPAHDVKKGGPSSS